MDWSGQEMASFVLVHGSWHGAWCWERLIPHLEEAGHEVVAIDLPAHGNDRSFPWSATLSRYADCIVRAAQQCSSRPFAVGHSMGGMAISEAAGSQPEVFAGLVYLCALVPRAGDSLLSLWRTDANSHIARNTRPGLAGAHLRAGCARSVFYNTCSDSDATWAAERLRPDPLRPMLARTSRDVPASLSRACIVCTEDQAISIEHQRNMAQRVGIGRVATMKADHSPFLSAPVELSERLSEIAK
jgi:pimeloyl-ACP methyl ester carboxylesterase